VPSEQRDRRPQNGAIGTELMSSEPKNKEGERKSSSIAEARIGKGGAATARPPSDERRSGRRTSSFCAAAKAGLRERNRTSFLGQTGRLSPGQQEATRVASRSDLCSPPGPEVIRAVVQELV